MPPRARRLSRQTRQKFRETADAAVDAVQDSGEGSEKDDGSEKGKKKKSGKDK